MTADRDDSGLYDEPLAMLDSKIKQMEPMLTGRGGQLSAIAIHPHTHRVGASVGAHNVSVVGPADELIKQGEEEFNRKIIRVTSKRAVEVNPKHEGWRQQLRGVADSQDQQAGKEPREDTETNDRWVDDLFASIEEIEDAQEDKISADLGRLITTTLKKSFNNAWTTESAKVGAALMASEVDGPEAERLGTVGSLMGTAQGIWSTLYTVSP